MGITLRQPSNTVPVRTVIEDGMKIVYDLPLAMPDGTVHRADLYRPVEDGRFPVIASLGAYGKNHPFQEPPYTSLWEALVAEYPEVLDGSSGRHVAFEVTDPERWVPHGYAVLRIDSRGAGRSEGVLNTHSYQEALDYKEWIEWAARQPWSNGKVGLSGISYFAVNQWLVATLEPKGLAALCIWEGASDWYRDTNYHGGIPCDFLGNWFPVQATIVQYGLGSRGPRNPFDGIQVAGDVDLPDEVLEKNRVDYPGELAADHSKVKTPLLSAGNWGGQGLHGRSNLLGFVKAASEHKYLEVHGGEHWTLYYADYGLDLQKRFFDYYLKGEGDWEREQSRVQLQVRHVGEHFVQRAEAEWPLVRTQWTPYYFNPGDRELSWTASPAESEATYEALGEGLTLYGEPVPAQTEITGPVSVKIFISSDTADADIFLVLRVFDPEGREVLFQGANDPHAPIGQGWLRASHRKLDPERSKPWLPFHLHLEEEPLIPGQVYELDIEVWPTSLVIPAGYRIAVSVLGRDYDNGLPPAPSHIGPQMRGCAFFLHPDRPAEIYDNYVTVYGGGNYPSRIVLPVIPSEEQQ
jgi:predicted acyl esterase